MATIHPETIDHLNAVDARPTEGSARTIDIGLFIGDEWQADIQLDRKRALRFLASLADAINSKFGDKGA